VYAGGIEEPERTDHGIDYRAPEAIRAKEDHRRSHRASTKNASEEVMIQNKKIKGSNQKKRGA
jgi:hypothetical protein